jgi:hypothetical protein
LSGAQDISDYLDVIAGLYTQSDSYMDLAQKPEYSKLLLSFIPESGESIGNVSLRDRLQKVIAGRGDEMTDQGLL